jgi:hypothetical protein
LEQAIELCATTYSLLNRNVSNVKQARQVTACDWLYRVTINLFCQKLNVIG